MQGLYLLLVLFLTAAIVGFIVGDHPGGLSPFSTVMTSTVFPSAS
jgi:hypothetical protein